MCLSAAHEKDKVYRVKGGGRGDEIPLNLGYTLRYTSGQFAPGSESVCYFPRRIIRTMHPKRESMGSTVDEKRKEEREKRMS